MAPSTFAQFLEEDSDEEDNLRGPSITVTSPEGSTAASTRAMRPQSAASRGGRAPLSPASPAGSLGAGLLGGSSKSSGSSKKKDKRGSDRHDLGPTDLLHGRSLSPQPGDESQRRRSDSQQHSMTSLGPVDGLRKRSVSPAPGGGESRHSKRKDQSDRHSMTSIGPIDGLRNRSSGEDHMAGGGSKSSKHKQTDDADRHQPSVLGIGPIEGLRGRSPSPIPGRGSLDTPGAHDVRGSSTRAASRSRLEGSEDDKKAKKGKKEKKEKKDKKGSRHLDEQADFEDSLDDLSAGASQWAPKRVDDHSHKERKNKKEKKEKHRDDDLRGDSFMSAEERPSHEVKSKKDKKSKKEESERITGSRPEPRTWSEDADLTGETTASSAHKGHKGRTDKKEKKEKAGSRAPVPALSRQNSDSGSLLDDDGFTLAEKADGEPARTVPGPPQSFGCDPGGDDDLMARLGGGGETASTLKASAPHAELAGSQALPPQRPTSAPQTSWPARPTPARPSPARPVSAAHTSLTKGRQGRSVARFLLRFEQGREAIAVEWVDGEMKEIQVPRSVLATARSGGTPAEGYAMLARILMKQYPEILQPEHCKPVEALLKQLDDAKLEAAESRSAQRYIFSVTAAGGAPWAPRLPPASSEPSWTAPEPRARLPLGAKLLVRARVRRPDGWWLNLEGYGGWIPETLTGGCCVERWEPSEAELTSWLREARPLVEATSTTKGGLQARTREAVYDHLQPRG